MFQKKALKILELFFYVGEDRIQISRIIKKTKYDFKTVKKYLQDFINKGIIIRYHDLTSPTYKASRENPYFQFLKKTALLEEVYLSGLPHYLKKEIGNSAVVAFNLFEMGKDSPLYLYIQGQPVLNFDQFEKFLKRKIIFVANPGVPEKFKRQILKGSLINGELK